MDIQETETKFFKLKHNGEYYFDNYQDQCQNALNREK